MNVLQGTGRSMESSLSDYIKSSSLSCSFESSPDSTQPESSSGSGASGSSSVMFSTWMSRFSSSKPLEDSLKTTS